MIYKELRAKLRGQGFINHEIHEIWTRYLIVRAMGVGDEDITFDRDAGLVLTDHAKIITRPNWGKNYAVDHDRGIAYEVRP